MGDFNINVASPSPYADRLKTILYDFNFQQHVTDATHVNGHTIDLIISLTHEHLSIKVIDVDRSVTSDHFGVVFTINCPKPAPEKQKLKVRKWKNVNISALDETIASHIPAIESAQDPFAAYNNCLTQVVDEFAPETTIEVTKRTDTPWYNAELRHLKTECRRLERKWRRTQLKIDQEIYRKKCRCLRRLRDRTKMTYISSKLQNATSTKDTYNILNQLLHKQSSSPLPRHDDEIELAEMFSSFFSEKIERVRSAIGAHPDPDVTIEHHLSTEITHLTSFRPVSRDWISKTLSSTTPKSCNLDPIPTALLRKCPSAVPLLCFTINWSLANSTMPDSHKTAHVRPRLKKTSLDHDQLKNYRPVSNLSFISKMTEKAIVAQLKDHCFVNNIDVQMQSAYRAGHSTETAMVRVQNDLLDAVDRDGGAILVLLDLSAAFDTLDHPLILHALKYNIGVTDSALKWFESYLTNRKQLVTIGSQTSDTKNLVYGVPQGSVLGPILFTMYTRPLSNIISNCGMNHHLYADDTQLYIAVNVRSPTSVSLVKESIQECSNQVHRWMTANFLKVNEEKTEVLVITKPSLTEIAPSSFNIIGETITSSASVRNLGVVLDNKLSMADQVRNICQKSFFHLHMIRKIRNFITEDAARQLVHANVMSYIDYCNALLAGSPSYLIDRLQHIQNCAARLVKCADRHSPSLPLLKELHWLPIKFRIMFKINVITFKALRGLAPPYICSLINVYTPARSLRSSNFTLLSVPKFHLQSYGYRTFAHQAPILWNRLPSNLQNQQSLDAFKAQLKTYYFNIAFSSI
jgi:hypothetical protein